MPRQRAIARAVVAFTFVLSSARAARAQSSPPPLAYAVGGWIASALQLTGIILTLVAANSGRAHLVRDPTAPSARIDIAPLATSDAVGVTLVFRML